MERSIFRTVQTMKKLINGKVDTMASGLPSPSKLSTRWLELFIIPESGKLLKDDPTVRLLRVLGRMVRSSVLTFCVFNSIITVVGYPACIYGKSMQPELNCSLPRSSSLRSSLVRLDLDWVWVSCWRARSFSFSRGDIVVFVSPKEPYDFLIKRVIGLEGDTVTSHDHSPIRVKIPQGHCWVEGDNWSNSVDSNKYGPIPQGLIFGVATHVIWPAEKWRRLSDGIPSRLEPERVEEGGQLSRPRRLLQKLKIFFYFFSD